MDFGKNLAFLRKERNISQEELADRICVSRQTVYKWETGITSPDVTKLAEIASALGVSTDLLLSNNAEENKVATDELPVPDKEKSVKTFTLCSSLIGWGVCAILLGVALLILFNALNFKHATVVGLCSMFALIFASVIGFVFAGIKTDALKEDNAIALEFTDEEKKKAKSRFTVKLLTGLALIFIAVTQMVVLSVINENYSSYAVAILLLLVGVGVALIVTGGMNNTFFTATKEAFKEEKKDKLEDTVSSVIMIIATAVFFAFGFIADKWHPAWIAFPIGAVLSGLSSKIVKLIKPKAKNEVEESETTDEKDE